MLRGVNQEALSDANSDMKYVMGHWEELKTAYRGEWIAVYKERVIYHGKDPREVREQAHSYMEQHNEKGMPFLVRLPEEGEDDSIIY